MNLSGLEGGMDRLTTPISVPRQIAGEAPNPQANLEPGPVLAPPQTIGFDAMAGVDHADRGGALHAACCAAPWGLGNERAAADSIRKQQFLAASRHPKLRQTDMCQHLRPGLCHAMNTWSILLTPPVTRSWPCCASWRWAAADRKQAQLWQERWARFLPT